MLEVDSGYSFELARCTCELVALGAAIVSFRQWWWWPRHTRAARNHASYGTCGEEEEEERRFFVCEAIIESHCCGFGMEWSGVSVD